MRVTTSTRTIRSVQARTLAARAGAAQEPPGETFQLNAGGTDRISWGVLRQLIEGFGAADTNEGDDGQQVHSDATSDLLFGTGAGQAGLSLCRLQLVWGYNGITDEADMLEHANSLKAAARGARLWAAPWSPPWESPNIWKTPAVRFGSTSLKTENYSDWAAKLAAAQAALQAFGQNLYAISLQNEPDWQGDPQPACLYSESETVAFIKVLGPALAALSPRPKLMIGELAEPRFGAAQSLIDAVAADSEAASYVDIFAYHEYFGGPGALTSSWPIWQTEVSELSGAFDGSMSNGMTWALKLHNALTVEEVSAYHYFCLKNVPAQDDTTGNISLIKSDDTTSKRLWAFAHWSKFVRPGYRRYATTSPTNLHVTAFRDPSTGRSVVVVINNTGSSQDVTLSAASTINVTPYRTSSSQDLVTLSDVSVGAGGTTVSLPDQTFTTFVGPG